MNNETLRYMQTNNSYNQFLLDNIRYLYPLISNIINKTKIIDLSNQLVTNYRTIPNTSTLENTYKKVIEFNPSNIYALNDVVITNEMKNYDALTAYNSKGKKNIFFYNNNEIEDVAVLIHEISHYTNLPDDINTNSTIRNLLTESIAYKDEFDYLDTIKDKDIRIQEFKSMVNDLYDTYCLLMPLYFEKKYGTLLKETYNREFGNTSNYDFDITRLNDLILLETSPVHQIINNGLSLIFMPYLYNNNINIGNKVNNINTIEELFKILDIKNFEDPKLMDEVNNFIIEMKNYLEMYIVFGPDLTRDQIISIEDLDKEVYDDKYQWEDEYSKKVFEKTKEGIISIVINNKIIGYIWLLSITKEAYEHTKQSDTIIDDYSLDELIPISKTDEIYLSINSIVIDPIYQDGEAIIMLTEALKEYINELEENYNLKGINATCVSPDGEKAVSYFGLSFYKDNIDNTKLYIKE